MSYLFSFRDIKQNVLLRFYLDNWWRHKLEDLCSTILWSKKKRRQKSEYFENEQNFLDEINSIFLGLSFGEKIKNCAHKL